MPNEDQFDPRKAFVPRFLPWLLGATMFVVYLLTLNHWVTLINLSQVALVSGWVWQPNIFGPLTFLGTLPFRWLPAADIPLALNVFSALCAAAALGVLARSVAILPHDRTEMERLRERSDFSFLTGWMAWVPPIAAVIFAGLQLTFWQHATNFTAESFQLLWFAVILWQLLEFRLDEAEWRLYLATVLYGAGMADNWALVALFPLFLTMLIWLRKLDFFSVTYLARTALCGLTGMLLYLLLPVLIKFSDYHELSFWQALKPNLQGDWQVIKAVQYGEVRHNIAFVSLTSFLPAFMMAMRWSANFGDSSKVGSTLVNYMMYLVNLVILSACVWVAFDPPFSPHQLVHTAALTPSFVTALCIGYYCGYFLLVFGKEAVPTRRNPRPEPALPEHMNWLSPLIAGASLVVLGAAAALLVYRNVPMVHALNDDTLSRYAKYAAQKLPPDRGIILADSEDPAQDEPYRAYLLQAELAREGRARNYAVVDTFSLNWATYHRYLHKRFPDAWPQTVGANDMQGVPIGLIFVTLNQLSKSNNLCYLNPSFGYYFEQFYQQPRGVVYPLRTVPETMLAPALDKALLAENQSFWAEVLQNEKPRIQKAIQPPDYSKMTGPVGWAMNHLHAKTDPNPNALFVATIYSRSLNYFGVQLQRAGELAPAAKCFVEAMQLNPDNVVAGKNLEFNKLLAAHKAVVVNPAQATTDQFGKYHSWSEVLGANGPYDDPSFCFAMGWNYTRQQPPLWRQALVEFNRVYQVAPDNLAARLFMAQIYVMSRLPDQAAEVLHDPLTDPERFALTDYNSTELHTLAAAVDFQKSRDSAAAALLEAEIQRHPDDEALLLTSAQVFIMHGMYPNAQKVIKRKLELTPDDPQWIYGKGIVSMLTSNYSEAIPAFSHLLQIQTNNPDVLFKRAYAYFQADRLDSARTDFLRLQQTYTNMFQIAYALGEIAWRKHDTNEAVRNYEIFAANAPTNTIELPAVRERLAGLRK
jgi:tetratricopeptide (TPR) repeat protein